jgi:replicative DNA helicase Mcm
MIAEQILNSQLNVETAMNHDFIRKYISYARNEIHPTMSEEANDRIKSFYQEWRKFTEYSTTPVTARQLLALVRLAKACARIRLSDTVTVEDAEVAIELEKYCINQGEYQINDGTIMNVQNKEDKKMHETMMEVMENLKEDFNNEIPTRFCIRDLKNATGKDSDYVQRWLYQMEREEKFVFNQNSGTWSVL